ncbi:MAG: hypothetical protein DHS20C17_32290 [Cyclobacteriaceae bacterium]|nr:MAG: hypothetical protein DHS20C17_32290 [Cyclobacteriaceae bacterium]
MWYDVQENYQRNISYQSAYPKLLKPLLKATLWLLEHGSRPFVDHYLLAEKGYVQELTFTKNRSTVLENKFVPPAANVPKQSRDWFQLVFTGTCSRENGILEAIALAEALIKNSYPIRLDIVGQVPDAGILREIRKRAGLYENGTIQLIGDGQLVQHQTIMEYAANADFGLVAYQPNPSNQNCIPTKIYEYLGLRLPMLLQTHPLWVSLVNPYNAALVLDFNQYQPDEVWKELHNAKFYTTLPGPEISWEQEAQKLIMVLS